jgi:hypothetical protein
MLNCVFKNQIFKSHILKSHFLKSQTQTDPKLHLHISTTNLILMRLNTTNQKNIPYNNYNNNNNNNNRNKYLNKPTTKRHTRILFFKFFK